MEASKNKLSLRVVHSCIVILPPKPPLLYTHIHGSGMGITLSWGKTRLLYAQCFQLTTFRMLNRTLALGGGVPAWESDHTRSAPSLKLTLSFITPTIKHRLRLALRWSKSTLWYSAFAINLSDCDNSVLEIAWSEQDQQCPSNFSVARLHIHPARDMDKSITKKVYDCWKSLF